MPSKAAHPEYLLDISAKSMPVVSGNFRLGGINRHGRALEFTNYYMLRDGKICIPVMGEFHFSRYPREYWEDELLKMKAGGIEIVGVYVFWIHIEEEEGVFNWSGDNDLRAFIALCKRHALQVIARIGPFAHGECRNGGYPDWLYGRPFAVRSNDRRYLAYVERLYTQIAKQLDGLLFKDDGPVIGVQLDNEYQHCGAPWEAPFKPGAEWVPKGSEGVEHIVKLKQSAISAGLEVPLYTCTGWLDSPIPKDGILPMQGGYAFTPWNPDPDYVQPPTREFLFRNRHLNPVTNGEPTYEAAKYPYACCEIGSGIQVTYYHRPIVPPESVEALALVNLAGGANIIGYYMYHGGSHPVGRHSYMNEYTVPRISYDFQAPIREFGQIADSYRCLRLLHLFLKDFGGLLAPMQVVLPDDAGALAPEDSGRLRYAARCKDGAGFVFLNNYQDHVIMQDIPDIRIRLRAAGATLSIPRTGTFTLQKDASAILPFGLSLEGVRLEYATAQLLAKVDAENEVTYFFFAPRGMASEYTLVSSTFQGLSVAGGKSSQTDGITTISVTPGMDCVITLLNGKGERVRIVTLTREQAERCSKQVFGQRERLFLCEATVVVDGESLHLYSTGQEQVDLFVYPAPGKKPAISSGALAQSAEGIFSRYTLNVPKKEVHFRQQAIEAGKAVLTFPSDLFQGVDNVLLRIDYVGDIGNAFIDGKLIHDHFYNGASWEIGLKHFARELAQKELFIGINPILQNTGGQRYIPTGMAFPPETSDDYLARIDKISAVAEYKITLKLLNS